MQRFQQAEPKKKKLPAPLLLFVLIVVLLFLLSSVIGLVRKQVRIDKSIRQLKAQRETLVEKQKTLEDTVAYLETTDGKEQVLRDKYRLVKPGEGLIVITEPSTVHVKEGESRGGFFSRFIRVMKDIFSKKE